jgi:hypothetical protein
MARATRSAIARRYSTRPITRFQFLMLRAMEADRTVSEATEDALEYGDSHPRVNLYEMQPYQTWLRREQRTKRPGADRLESA